MPQIAKRVDFVGGVLRLPQIRTLKTKPIESDGSQAVVGSVTPALIMQWYNITALKTFSPMNSQSVSQFLNQYMDPSGTSEDGLCLGLAGMAARYSSSHAHLLDRPDNLPEEVQPASYPAADRWPECCIATGHRGIARYW